MRKVIILGVFLFILAALGGVFFLYQEKNNQTITNSEENSQQETTISSQNSSLEVTETMPSQAKESLPKTFKLNVPFIPQAPLEIWDEDHNEACEEAAILTLDTYFKKKELTPEMADKEILAMIDYQKKNWQGHFDLPVEDIVKLAEEFYGYKDTKIKYDISIEDIKREIASGNPVILPCAGRMLFGPLEEGKNPYYRSPGPLYHMLVAIGWDDEKGIMIVNDPGTKRGKDFSFKYEVLENAIHDWTPSTHQPDGQSAMIVLNP
jgi:hypothetical protein